MPKRRYRPVIRYQPVYPVPAELKQRYGQAEAVERLGSSPPRSLPVDVLPSSFAARFALLMAILVGAGAVGVFAGVIGYEVAAEIGGVVKQRNTSGVFIDGTGAFWILAGIVVALVGVAGACYSLGRLGAAGTRASLVEYRRAVEEWRSELETRLRENHAALNSAHATIEARDAAFHERYIAGRAWLAAAFADLSIERDAVREFVLRNKPHPGVSSANVLRQSAKEKRAAIIENRLLRMQLASYEEYFPELLDYRELILDEAATFVEGETLEDIDPVRLYLTPEEYAVLSSSERNQHALDRYKSRHKTDWEIGRWYERQIGWMLESSDWKVTYEGALRGFADFGRDLIGEESSRLFNARTGPVPR
jgi:hypothetical protein